MIRPTRGAFTAVIALSLLPLGGISTVAVDGPAEHVLVVRPDLVAIDVGETRKLRVFRCQARADGAGARLGRDGRPGTRDDGCRPQRQAAAFAGPEITLAQDADDGSRLTITGVTAGFTDIDATSPAADSGTALVIVTEGVPADDPSAIGARPRGGGDVNGDGRIDTDDVDLLSDVLASDPRGYIPADEAAFIPAASVLGNGVLSDLDLGALEDRVAIENRRRRAVRRGRTDLTPGDIVPLEAGGFGIIGAVLDASGTGDLPGAFRVNIVGPDRLYFQGIGGWGLLSEGAARIVLEQPGVMVFTVDEPGFGFAGHQTATTEFADTVSFDAVSRGESLALPATSRRLVVPYDVDLDNDADWDDYFIVAASLGMFAGDRGFPGRGDANADGVITLEDAALIAPVIDIVGPGTIGGMARSGDLDGDGDVDARDVRAAATHARVMAEFEPNPDAAIEIGDLLTGGRSLTDAAAIDVDADGDIDADDVGVIAERAGLDLDDLGPFYTFVKTDGLP